MSYAQAPALRAHLQNLCDTGAAITAYPDAVDLVTTWGANEYTLGHLVYLVREHCPRGYIVPFVCKHTDMRLIMAKGNGNMFTYALMAIMSDIKYCRTRLRRIARNLRNMAAGFPVSSAFRTTAEGLATVLEGVTASSVGALDIGISQLPLLATRARAAERALLASQAAEYLAMTA